MRHYRMYLLDAADHFRGAEDSFWETDLEAFTHAAGLIGAHAGVEIWESTRLVGRFAG